MSNCATIQERRSFVPSATEGVLWPCPTDWVSSRLYFSPVSKGDKSPRNEVTENKIHKSVYDEVDLPTTIPSLLTRSTPASPGGLSHKL